MKLWAYWRSTTSCRGGSALNKKGIADEGVPVDLAAWAQGVPLQALDGAWC